MYELYEETAVYAKFVRENPDYLINTGSGKSLICLAHDKQLMGVSWISDSGI